MENSPFSEAESHSPRHEIPRLYWNRKLVTVLKRARQFSLWWARWIQSTISHPISLIFVPITPPPTHTIYT